VSNTMPDTTTINGIISIMRDIRLEVKTAMRELEFDDPVNESFEYIDSLARVAVEKLKDEVL